MLDQSIPRASIAYFSMEIALHPEVHTYSGGLGILAGDMARTCADLELPIVFVTLVSRLGYLRQEIDAAGRQVEHPDPWSPRDWARPLGAKIVVRIEGREVWVRPWVYEVEGMLESTVSVILLDTDLDENPAEDRRITDRLYGGDDAYRLKQEMVLGIGGVRILQSLGLTIETYHMNEGHSALLGLELLRRFELPAEQQVAGECVYDLARVRELCVFTTHTPVEAAHDRFAYDLVRRMLGDYVDVDQLKLIAGRDSLNMTRLALNLSGYVNGVAKRHAETSSAIFLGRRIHAITNGVHVETWTCPSFASVFDAHLPGWRHEPEILVRADRLPEDVVWSAHQQAKRRLLQCVADASGIALDLERPVIGFARRMTGYKRLDLIFADLQRLRAIGQRYPLQMVVAGKAHPRDRSGKDMIERIHGTIRQLADSVRVAFLPNYDMEVARSLVSGADVWLNTPLAPLEASGTSGMKAALNGVLNLSVLDGWWVEAWIEGETGWAIGAAAGQRGTIADADELYDKLERAVLPLYYADRRSWNRMMRESISKIGCYFNSHRMVRRYATEAYLR